ncbi:MAG: hypothetical protein MI923_30605 [Phycisphaerales bacterium]|nr:hypothetical protein [Phycisphaerales bacterium]
MRGASHDIFSYVWNQPIDWIELRFGDADYLRSSCRNLAVLPIDEGPSE